MFSNFMFRFRHSVIWRFLMRIPAVLSFLLHALIIGVGYILAVPLFLFILMTKFFWFMVGVPPVADNRQPQASGAGKSHAGGRQQK